MLSDKYSPQKPDDIIGQSKAVTSFVNWYDSWRPGDKPALLVGDTGTGKTSLIKSLALERNLDFIEINASDKRNAEAIRQTIGEASKQMSLFRKGKIILLDEVDGLSGTQDRGGPAELLKIVKSSKFPIVLTANNAYLTKLRNIRINSDMIKFSKVHANSIASKLKEISKLEGVDLDNDCARRIAASCGGDFRSALNDLEILLSSGKIEKEDIELLGYREKEQDIFNLMKLVFKSSRIKVPIDNARETDKNPDEIFWWIEENIPNEYENPEEVAKAFDWLSKADIMKSRIRKRQNWRFQKYMIDLMCGGVSSSKKDMYRKFSRYQPPQRLQKMFASKLKREKRKEVCSLLSPLLHASSRIIIRDYFPLLRKMNKEDLIATGMLEDDIKILT